MCPSALLTVQIRTETARVVRPRPVRGEAPVTIVGHVGFPMCVSDPEDACQLGVHKGEGAGGQLRELGAVTFACDGNTEDRLCPTPPPGFRGPAHGESRQGTSSWESEPKHLRVGPRCAAPPPNVIPDNLEWSDGAGKGGRKRGWGKEGFQCWLVTHPGRNEATLCHGKGFCRRDRYCCGSER